MFLCNSYLRMDRLINMNTIIISISFFYAHVYDTLWKSASLLRNTISYDVKLHDILFYVLLYRHALFSPQG